MMHPLPCPGQEALAIDAWAHKPQVKINTWSPNSLLHSLQALTGYIWMEKGLSLPLQSPQQEEEGSNSSKMDFN